MPIELVPEVSFDPETRQFTFAKCDPFDPLTTEDPDCQGDPDFYSYEVQVIATLNDGQRTSNSDLVFSVTFGPDCTQDELTFLTPVPSPHAHFI